MQIQQINPEELLLNINLVKNHSDEQVEKIAKSIQEYGFNVPIVADENMEVLSGRGRLLASRSIGLDTVPVVVLTNLDESKKKAFILADNKLNEASDWDSEYLNSFIRDLTDIDFDIADIGFNAGDFNFAKDTDLGFLGEGDGNEKKEEEPDRQLRSDPKWALIDFALSPENKKEVVKYMTEVKNAEGMEFMGEVFMMMFNKWRLSNE